MTSRPNIMPWLLLAASCSPAEFVWQRRVPEPLASYRRAFDEAVGDRLAGECDHDQLFAAVQSTRVLWLGDHHRSNRLHALQGALLERLARTPRRVVLVLEALGMQDQPDVDAFLDDRLTLQELADRIRQRWSGSWLDDRELDPWYYRSLCSTARGHDWHLVALEPTPRPPLPQRDAAIAEHVRELAARHPQALLVVVVGQAHLLGEGDLVRRTGLPAVAIGGEPPTALAAAAPRGRDRLLRAGDLWWFAELFGDDAFR